MGFFVSNRIINRFKSIQLGGKAINTDEVYDGIAIIGSTCSGKTTLVNAVRKTQDNSIHIPKRYITRSQRLGDDLIENSFVNHDEFYKLVDLKKLEVYWERDLGGKKNELYAFETLDENKIFILSANNAFAKSKLEWINKTPNIIFIGINAEDMVREMRFNVRSPDVIMNKPKESRIRIGDKSESIRSFSHIIVNNGIANEQVAITEFISIIKDITGNA